MNNLAARLPPALYQRVTRAHEHHFPGSHAVRAGEVLLDSSWRIELDSTCGPLTELAAKDLRGTLAQVFGVKPRRPTRLLRVLVASDVNPSREASTMTVGAEGIDIRAASDEAAMRALFDLRWRLLNRQAPVIPAGQTQLTPAWSVRIMSPVWHRPIDQPADYLALPEAYLLNAARYGYNATYLFGDWFDYLRPRVGGRLARPGVTRRLSELRQATAYLGRFGIRLLLHINTMAMAHDHPWFAAHPQQRGAQTWRAGEHCLCSSHPRTLELYRAAAAQLFADVPELAGAVLIVGGECFLHCYTRPMPQTARGTNCPRCARQRPERVIARMVNAFAAGAVSARQDALVMMWPYSAFTWGDVPVQQRLLKQLDPAVSLLTSFEKDDYQTLAGVKSFVFDYSISRLGPSPVFRRLQRTARQAGLKVFARTESAQCIELFSVPRLPIMQRWGERFAAIRALGVDGVHTAWRFYGFCAQRNDELVYAGAWHPALKLEQVLHTLAARDFGARAAPLVLRAWQRFSAGFAAFPYCAGVTGFPYFRGPFYLGPAHPFVFDTTRPHGIPEQFWTVNPAMEEAVPAGPRGEISREPRFFLDLTWTQPYGAQRVATALKEVERQWRQGLALLTRAETLTRASTRQAWQEEHAIATLIHCILVTARHLLAFQQLRQQVTGDPCTPAQLRRTCQQAQRILAAEIANAQTALQLVQADASLGYGATYGYAFTAALIEAKLAQCQQQMTHTIPRFYDIHAFHCFGMRQRTLG